MFDVVEFFVWRRQDRGLRMFPMFKKSICGSSAADCSKNQELIQQLITRLLTESENEATQKGWCDTEIGKARSLSASPVPVNSLCWNRAGQFSPTLCWNRKNCIRSVLLCFETPCLQSAQGTFVLEKVRSQCSSYVCFTSARAGLSSSR